MPIKRRKKSNNDFYGWVIIGLQYCSTNSISANLSSSASADLESKTAAVWLKLLSDSSISMGEYSNVISLIHKSNNTLSSSLKSSSTNFRSLLGSTGVITPESVTLHIALGSLQLSTLVALDLKSSNHVLIITISSGIDNYSDGVNINDSSNTIGTLNQNKFIPTEISGSAVATLNSTDAPIWKSTNIIITSKTNLLFSPLLYITLYRGKKIDSTIDPETAVFVGEAVVIVSRSSLISGTPIDLISPLRDRDGLRVSIVELSVQKTSIHSSAMKTKQSPIIPDFSNIKSTINKDNIPLDICLFEGSIIDPFWKYPVEPYFELTLVPPSEKISMEESVIWKSKTEFIQNSSILDKNMNENTRKGSASSQLTSILNDIKTLWNLNNYLTVPKDGFPFSPAEEMSQPLWCINIVCRDAARYNCPIISSAKIGI